MIKSVNAEVTRMLDAIRITLASVGCGEIYKKIVKSDCKDQKQTASKPIEHTARYAKPVNGAR
jgi:hypothetical protein